MARVTVEDCITEIPNRFELVIMAANRAKAIAAGAPLSIDRDNDKDTVVALREIADQTIDLETINEDVIQRYQRRHYAEQSDEAEKETIDADVAETLLEETQGGEEAPKAATAESPEGMSFSDENLNVED